MKGIIPNLSFFIMVVLLMARPVILFSSGIFQQLSSQEVKSSGLVRHVRNRNSFYYIDEKFITNEDQEQKLKLLLTLLSFSSLKKLMYHLLNDFSLYLSLSSSRFR